MKKLTIKYSFTLVALLLMVLAACNEDRIDENQFGSIRGTVVVKGSNAPLANVRISTSPVSSTVFTDSLGQYLIQDVQTGEYSVEASKDDFIGDFEPAIVEPNRAVTVVFELDPSTANNRPPSAPQLLSPEQNEVLQSIEGRFNWIAQDPDGDPITYWLELRNTDTNEVMLFEDLTDTTLVYSPLTLGANYVWQVAANDGINEEDVLSPVGEFEVIGAPIDNRFLFVRTMDENNVIYSADEGGAEFQLTSSLVNSYKPRRNVAANKIAYLQTDGAEVDIYTMNRDGSEKTKVTSTIKPAGFNLNEIDFAWPATSDKIYFPQFDKLYRINSNGQGIELVYQTTDGSLISEVDVSENANIIALKTNNLDGYDVAIYTIDFDGNVLNNILDDVPGAASGVSISVTNQQILYSYDVSGFESGDYRRLDSRLFIYDLVNETTEDVSQDKPSGTNDLQPMFSPNEAFAIFTNTSNDGISQRNIVRLEFFTTDSSRVTLYENAFMPDWE